MLGPDPDTLTEVLADLGERHIRYGVKAHYFPSVGVAMTYALKKTLKDTWTDEMEIAWCEVYDEMSADLMQSILNARWEFPTLSDERESPPLATSMQ